MADKPTYEELEKRVAELERQLDHFAHGYSCVEVQKHRVILNEAEKLAGLGGWEWDMEKDQWSMSRNWLRIHGCSKSRLSTRELIRIAHPDDIAAIQKALDQAAADGTPYEIEHRIIRQDSGEIRNVRAYGKVIKDDAGRPVKMFGAALDITKQNKDREALERIENLIDQSQEIANVGSFSLNSATQKVVWSNQQYRIFGYQPGEVEPDFELVRSHVHPDDRDGFIRANNAAFTQMQEYENTYRIIKKDGATRTVRSKARVEYDTDQNALRTYGTLQDITESIAAEKALQESEALFRQLTALSPGGIYKTAPNGDCVYANDAWLRIAGMTLAQAKGEGWMKAIHPDDREAIGPAWYKMVGSKGRWGHEYRFQTADGVTTWVYGLALPIYDSQHEISGYLGLNFDITDRKHAERALLNSKKRYQALFDDSPVPLWEEDFTELFDHLDAIRATGVENFRGYFNDHPSEVAECVKKIKILDVNQATLELHGAATKEELIGNLDKVFTENSLAGFLEELIALADGKDRFEIEGEVKTLSGKRKYVFLRLTVNKEHPVAIRALLSTIDITERKQMEEALRASQERLDAFLDNSPVGLGLWDDEFRYLYLNDQLQKMNGPSIEAHLGKTIEEMLPKAAPVIRPQFEKIMSTCAPLLNMELSGELPARPGEICHYLVSFFPISVIDGRPKFIGGVVVDITERKRAEEALRKSEEKYRQLIELAQEGIWAIDKDSCTSFVNPSMATMLGYTPEEMNGKHLYSFMDSKGREIAEKNLQRRKSGIAEQHDFEFIRKDGQRIYAAVETAPILDEEGNYSGAIAGIIDLTGRRNAELERNMLQSRLAQAQKMESIGNLAGGIAHDFNNILTSIIGFTELALDDVDKGSTVEDSLQEIFAAGNRAKKVISQILAFARQADVTIKPIRVNIIIKEVLDFIRSTIPTTIEIKQHLESSSQIMGNTTQLHQVVMNLCSNAAQAMSDHGGVLEVSLRDIVIGDAPKWQQLGLKPGDYIDVTVSDTGSGINPDIIEQIFEPYFTTKAQGEGSGLGLAMVNGIVESYGGKVTVKSAPDQGARFSIYLPITSKSSDPEPYRPVQAARGEEHILFIDDEAAIVRLSSRMLERLGYKVTTRTSSIEALALFQQAPDQFDLVITDMTMPHMTGDALARRLLKIRPDLSIILCTGYSEKISAARTKEIGIKAFASKPVSKVDMARTIRKVLDSEDPDD